MAKAAFNKEKTIVISKLDISFRKKLVNATFGAQICVTLKRGTL
jgi:hypothetical protein